MSNEKKKPAGSVPAASRYTGDVAANYDRVRSGKKATEADQAIVESWLRSLEPGSTICDVPVGTGRFLQTMIAQRLKVKGFDISADMIAEARKKLPGTADGNEDAATLEVADAGKLPIAEKSVDFLVSVKFVKWVPTDAQLLRILKEFNRVTRKEVVIQVKIRRRSRNLLSRIKSLLRRKSAGEAETSETREDAEHRARSFFQQDIERIIETAGFEISRWVDNPATIGKPSTVRFYFLRPVEPPQTGPERGL